MTKTITTKRKIYLASRSPRRGEILTNMGIDFEVVPSDIDESVLPDEEPDAYVLRLARKKAEVCLEHIRKHHLQELPVLAADTTVCMDGDILGKPEDDADAATMLRHMSGRVHWVHTAVAVGLGDHIETALSSTVVSMAELSKAQIAAYIATGEPRDKAGAYGIQGMASLFIKRIDGSYSGVMGLPIFETGELLKKFGVEVL